MSAEPAVAPTDRCSRCGRPYSEHPHHFEDEHIIGNPHAFRTPSPWRWPDGEFPSWQPRPGADQQDTKGEE